MDAALLLERPLQRYFSGELESISHGPLTKKRFCTFALQFDHRRPHLERVVCHVGRIDEVAGLCLSVTKFVTLPRW
jgi:hypothetical protein